MKLKLVSLDEMGLYAPSKMHWEQTDSMRDVFLLFWWGQLSASQADKFSCDVLLLIKTFKIHIEKYS